MFMQWVERFERKKGNTMSKADKMFEELGYEIEIENKKRITYVYEGQFFDKYIIFEIIDKHIVIELGTGESTNINMQELQAINEKCKELGWL